MKNITHFYSLNPEWQNDFAKGLGTKVIDNKIMIFPETIGNGHAYFTQVTAGISALFFDFELTNPLKITRLNSNHHLYIFHYDLSEQINLIKINNINYEIGSFEKLELAIIDNKLDSVFQPPLNKRITALRILVDKTLLNDFMQKYPEREITKNTTQYDNNTLYHYGNIDSNSILLIQSMKNKSIHDISFDSLLKGISLKLLGNFFNKFYKSFDSTRDITEMDLNAVIKTKEYLLNNLYGPFPSVTFIAAMAGMSESKYKILFKKCFDDTPNNFFIKEKMLLAQTLFKSGQFKTINDVVYTLSYSKASYFTAKYFEIFQHKPKDDFIKKTN
jgi:AraC-like DNA-binding protein